MTSPSNQLSELFAQTPSSQTFKTWFRKYIRRENLAENYESRNNPGATSPPTVHSPSQTGGCFRKQLYQQANAPRETELPHGIFEFGNLFERLFETYLRESIVGPQQFVRNPVHISLDVGEHTFSGSTDPVITDKHGTPLLLTECKTTGDISYVTEDGEPKRPHKRQAHIYAAGLRDAYDLDSYPPIFIIYADRSSLATTCFTVEWDPELWDDTLSWASRSVSELRTSLSHLADLHASSPTLSQAELSTPSTDTLSSHTPNESQTPSAGHPNGRLGNPDIIPPTLDVTKLADYTDEEIADTSVSTPDVYECSYCEYYARCGGGTHGQTNYDVDTGFAGSESITAHQPPIGFLPLTHYPVDAVIGHLLAHETVYLTPTLAAQHPALIADGTPPAQDLVNRYGEIPQRPVYHWVNPDTPSQQFHYDDPALSWHGDIHSPPTDPDTDTPLRGPTPVELLRPTLTLSHSTPTATD